MRMTLKDWDEDGCPGKFIGPGFSCWRTPSLLHPDDEVFHLVITTGKERHPFQDKYADPVHQFSSFYGLRQYLRKPPAEIEGEIDLLADTSLPPISPRMEEAYLTFTAFAEQFADEIRASTRKESVFQVRNHHDASCGTPPHIDDTHGDQRLYYFDDAHGGQLIFVYDRANQTGRLYNGAAHWEQVIPVVGGKAEGTDLSALAHAWLKVCWDAATQL